MNDWIRSAVLFALVAGLALFGCAENDSNPPSVLTGGTSGGGGTAGTPTIIVSDSICGRIGSPSGCFQSCSSDAQCADDTFCNNSQCDAYCTALGGQCESNQTCTRGRCVTMNSGTGGTGGAGGTGGTGGVCASKDINVDRVIPNIVLVVDRSSSMRWDFSGCNPSNGVGCANNLPWSFEPPSRWEALKAGLLDPLSGVLPGLQSIARFALDAFDNDGDGGTMCPRLLSADLALDNASTIQSVLDANNPGGGTPTAQAIQAVLQKVESATLPDGPTIFLLATDGEPTGCDTHDDAVDLSDTLNAIGDVAAAGYPTYVIGVGIASDNLRTMAQAGRPNDPNADYFPASDAGALADALHEIIGGQIPCKVQLQGQVDDGEAYRGTVVLNGTELEFENATRGWTVLPGGTELELLGSACDDWSSGLDASLSANFPCNVVLVLE
ncbi:MAG: vWA domain-containing protein [Polyangiales bacterium]